MPNFVKFRDTFNLITEVSQETRDYYGSLQQGQSIRPLIVKIAATHSGKITRNNGLYLPTEMRTATPSWTAQYPKPILTHHNDSGEPVGRTISARYVDMTSAVRDKFTEKVDEKARPAFNDTLDKLSGDISFDDAVELTRTFIRDNSSLLEDPDYEGLGYIELTARISDLETINKLLDGRYTTGSIGASAKKAICSVCKRDWAGSDGICEHRPGKDYDGKKCILMAGELAYDEYSFVNVPADRHSRVIEINVNGVQDFVEEEAGEMAASDQLEKQTLVLILDSVEPEVKPEDKKEEIEEIKEEKKEEDATDPVKAFWGDEYEAVVGDDLEEGKHYAQMIFEFINECGDETLKAEFKEKKLSSEQRKGLSKSTFCKPGERKYPVPDCSHAKSAMAYAKKYNESSSVIACIRRKAKRLGCPFEEQKEAMTTEVGIYTLDHFDIYEDQDLIHMFNGLRAVLKERSLETVECDALMDRIRELESNDQVETLQGELQQAYDNLRLAQETYAEMVEKVRSDKEQYLLTLKMNTEPLADSKQYLTELSAKSLEDIDKMVKDSFHQIDQEKEEVKIVTEPVENPVLQQNDTAPTAPVSENDKEKQRMRDWIMNQYLNMVKVDKVAASRWLAETKKKYRLED